MELISNTKRRNIVRKNFRKIPKHINQKLETLTGSTITTFAFLKLCKQDIIDGKYAHLNISLQEDKLIFPEFLIPKPSSGRYSKYNCEGREIKLYHLPKIPISHFFDSPNFGDSSKGYHTTTITREVWQKRLIPPRFLALIFSQEPNDSENNFVLKVSIDSPIDKSADEFNDILLFQCNLLQENIRNCNLTDTNIDNEKYVEKIQYVNWELLPPGELDTDNLVDRILNPNDAGNSSKREFIKERLLFFNELGAIHYIQGTSLFSSYTGAMFNNNIVLLENFDYGNAVYIFKEDWEHLTQLSRTELLSYHKKDIIRIKHTVNWKNNIKSFLTELTT